MVPLGTEGRGRGRVGEDGLEAHLLGSPWTKRREGTQGRWGDGQRSHW